MTTDNLFILAVDQRPWLLNALFGHAGEASPDERSLTTEAKHLVLDGLLRAVAESVPRGGAILVDPELGPGVPERAKARGVRLALPIERAGLRVYETEPKDLGGYLRHYAPEFSKVLVRYNPADDPEERALQRSRLAEASHVSRQAGTRFLFELLVPPTAEQLAEVDGDEERFDHELRPELTRQAMREILEEVGVDLWKLEHQGDLESSRRTVELARQHGGECIILGAGADEETVRRWLAIAAEAGYSGFAIGRSIWWKSVQQLVADPADDDVRTAACAAIARTYTEFAEAFVDAQS
ncbi:DUF2090 domain-containing protein [Leucobacter sp. CSA1]|uniref:DUF2090 domain-containing protein n=1 Tax=Leucobacter chromiisoli TaxID=2796471 RepID=A0A934Q9T8_9MICO|nr:DUF2090 domain-containing protein [Leucobacter chromiisoli]MBK0419412.1 DUF2090 domain-containing protein [Leucobacter chromiisoli]